MAHNETHKIELVKPADRALRDNVIQGNIAKLIKAVNTKTLKARGWELTDGTWDVTESPTREEMESYGQEGTYRYLFHMTITLDYSYPAKPEAGMRAGIVKSLARKSQTPAYGSWVVAKASGETYEIPADDDVTVDDPNAEVGYAPIIIPDNWDDYFTHLYGLEPHIRRVRKALELAIRSSFATRTNVVLVGPPGCGKSDVAESAARALIAASVKEDEDSNGDEAPASPVWKLDATATTAAGTIKELAEMELLPRVAIFEEAEKADEKVTEPFLGILDQRGEVRKTTARAKVQRDARLLVISTVNDYAKFQKMNAGALASRHTVKIFFNRPTRETLARVLAREVAKVHGDEAWITPTLDYCESRKIDDPREVISHCLNGAEDWLNGTYVKDLEATSASNAQS